MADQRRIIEFVFVGEDHLSPVTNSLADGLERVNDKVQGVAGPIGAFGENLVKAEAAVIAAGAALVGYTVNEAVKFQSATLDLKKVLDETDPNIESFKDAAIGTSNAFGVAATDVLQATSDFKQAGFNAEEALNLVDASLTLVNVSELNAAESAEVFIRILKGYGTPASDATRILDVLNEVSNVYAVNVGQLGEAMARSAPIAEQMGFSYEELAGIMTPMIEAFQSAELSSTAFNTVMQRLVGNSAPVITALGDLGISQKDLNGNMKSGKEILGEVQVAFQKLEPNMKLVIAQELAGVEQSAKMIKVFDELEKTTAVVATAMGAAGSAQKELSIRMEAAEVLINKATQAWNNAAILFGDQLLPAFSDVVKAVGSIGEAVQKAISEGAFKQLVEAGNATLEALTKIFSDIAKNLPEALSRIDFSGMIKALTDLGIEIGGMFEEVDLTTADGLSEAIQRVVDAIETLTNHTTGFVSQWVPVVKAIFEGGDTFSQLSPEAQKSVGAFNGLMSVISNAGPAIDTIAKSINLLTYAVGINSLSGALKNLEPYLLKATALMGPQGMVIAAGAAGFGIGTLITKFTGVNEALEPYTRALADYLHGPGGLLEGASLDAGTALEHMGGVMAGTSTTAEKLTDTTEATVEAVDASQVSWTQLDDTVSLIGGTFTAVADDQKSAAGVMKSATQETAEGIEDLLKSWQELGGVTQHANLDVELATKGFYDAGQEVHRLEDGTEVLSTTLSYAGQKATETGDKTATALSKTAEETLNAQKEANDFALSWEEIASKERQVIFEVSAQVAIAQIEADTARIQAAFDSVNVSIGSTGETMLGLAGILAQVGSGPNAGVIIDLLEQENDRRQQAFDLQKQLVEQQIRYLEAVNQRLTQGDAVITVTADGLEPELEAFMMKILAKIQVKASAEAQQFLLGL